MKDATGELSMTAVAVVAIAAISVVFTTLIWPSIKANIQRSSYCSQAFNCTEPTGDKADNSMVECYYCTSDDPDCANPKSIKCPAQGTETGGGA